MANGLVQVQPDSTGKKIQTFENTVGADVVEAQAVVPVDTAGAALVGQKTMAASLPVAVASDNVLTIQGNQAAVVTGSITTATSTVVVSAATNLNVATVTIHGTYAGVSFVIEGSDDAGTTWYQLQGIDNATGQIVQTITPGTNATKSYDVTVGGYNQFRVRATAFTSGTGNVRINMQAMPYEVAPGVMICDGTSGPAAVDATFKALRVARRPFEALGYYSIEGNTSTYSGLAANTPLFSMRWGSAAAVAVILKVEIAVITSAAASTAAITERQLIVARSFTVSDTGGTAVTLTGNNAKRRTSHATSLVTDMRFGTTITAGTRTLDANPVASVLAWAPLNHTGVEIGGTGSGPTSAAWSTAGGIGMVKMYDATDGHQHPIVLAQNEGLIMRIGAAQPTGSTQQTFLNVLWAEATTF